jgi:ribosomal-protein-alanine N-acetyltransferase
VPASRYDFTALASLYNAARVDYIVPMPMNAKRMQEYVHNYDVNLDGSIVSLNGDELETGVGMLALRDSRAWITRLGVIPERRGNKVGQFIMERLLEQATQRAAKRVQLEVIKGNEPAYRLFVKMGFEVTRALMILRRPPSKPDPNSALPEVVVRPLMRIPEHLEKRAPDAAWTEETRSLINAGGLEGLQVEMPSGERGWVIFQRMAFQLMHIVLSPNAVGDLALALLYHLHAQYPMQDTKVENVPLGAPYVEAYTRLGYVESFQRIEMAMNL